MPEKIYFYSRTKKFFELSNFSLHPIIVENKRYATNEHYFQSVKFLDADYQETIRSAPTPAKAKSLGTSRAYKIHLDWDTKRIDVMRRCVWEKFTQHKELTELLLSTGDSILIEDSPKDVFWGVGENRTGKNMLGKILMETREKLRKEKY